MDTLIGEVSNFRMRSELYGDSSTQIWVFLLQRSDADGSRLPPIPVEMRGSTARGMINDGDRVEVHGTWREGLFLAQDARNLTTQSAVHMRGYSTWFGRAFLVVAILLVLAFVGIMTAVLVNWR